MGRNAVQHLALVAFIAFAAVDARASIRVWHTAEPLSSNAFVEIQGFYWNPLKLHCDNSVGQCLWRIRTYLTIDDGTSETYSLWLRDPAGNATNLNVSQTSIAGSIYNMSLALQQNASSGIVSRIDARYQSPPAFLPASNTEWFLHSFVLTKTGAVPSGTTSLIPGSVGFRGFEPFDPGDIFRRVAVDQNPAYQITDPMEWPNPAIVIKDVPEPATLALIALAWPIFWRRGSWGNRTLP